MRINYRNGNREIFEAYTKYKESQCKCNKRVLNAVDFYAGWNAARGIVEPEQKDENERQSS